MIYPKGASPLTASCKLKLSRLASRKLVRGDPKSEGSETAKVGTDEQKSHTEANKSGLGNTTYQRLQATTFVSRCGRNWPKDNALTKGDLPNYALDWEKSAESIVAAETSQSERER